MLNDLLIKLWIITFVNSQNVTNYARRFKTTMQNIRRMIIYVSINDNLFILYFHLSLDAKFEQYREHYAQIHEIVSNESNLIKSINYAINRFSNTCINRSISRESTLVMTVITFVSNSSFDKIQSNAFSEIKNIVIIIVKMCTICEKKYHTTSEHREQFNLNFKRNRDQFDEERNDRDNKRKRKNDNDDDERFNSKIDDEEKSTRFTSSSVSRFWQSWALCLVTSHIKLWTRIAFNITYETDQRSSFTRFSRNSFLSAI
jgi:hypothetical protein